MAKIGSWEDDLTTNNLIWSEEMYRILGFPKNTPLNLADVTSIFPPDELKRFQDAVGAAINQNAPYSMDYKIIRPDGEIRYIHDEGEIVRDNNGNPISMFGTTQDITERTLIENTLRKNDKKFKAAFNQAPVGMILTGPDGRYLSINQAFSDLIGYTEKELKGTHYSEITHPDDVVKSEYAVNSLLTGKEEKINYEKRYVHKDGHPVCADVRVVLSRDDKNEPLFFITHVQDITDLKKTEEALKKSKHFLAEAQKIGKIGSFRYDFQKNTETWSDELYRILGIDPPRQMTFDKLFDYIVPEDHHLLLKSRELLFSDHEPVDLELRIITEDGTSKFISVKVELFLDDGINPSEIIGTVQDITGRKKIEMALDESRKHFEDVFRNAPVGIFQSSVEGKFFEVNQTLSDMLGYESPDELISIVNQTNANKKLYVDKGNRPLFISEMLRYGGWHSYENRFYRKDGSIMLAELSFRAVNNPDGSVKFLEGFVTDITQRKNAENMLHESVKEWERTFDAVPDLIAIIDNNYQISRVNQVMAHRFGLQSDEYVGLNCYEVMHGLNEPHPQCPYRHLQEDGLEHTAELHEDHLDGDFTVSVSPLHDYDGEILGCVHVVHDITPRKMRETQIKNSLEEKEMLLKEIHHRVKNNLQIISSLLELQEDYVQEDPTAVNVLNESQNRVLSMALIHETLYQSKDLSRINFSDYLQTLVFNLIDSYGAQKTITPLIKVDRVLLNIETSVPLGLITSELVSNSLKYAFPNDEGDLSISLKSHDDELELIISDNGIGFPDDVDFRNVKSSLGLQLVNSLIHQIDGTIDLDKSKGSKFIIKFREQKYKERL
ncbi:MAG: putative diguanylate cyclase [Methanobacterium sp. PtaU1.Bin242]|nr:MAG: putative diguanylate cyclase [Methanobacterium sp. PtaU1.Bin242]